MSKITSTKDPFSFVTNSDKTLCLLRIPKCASTTAVNRFELDTKTDVEEFSKSNLNIIIIRDPYERLLSSIPETISRGISTDKDFLREPYGDVIINNNEYEHLLNNINNNPASSFYAVLSTIQKYCFFDLHHLPISIFTNYCKSRNINPYILSCAHINHFSRLYSSEFGKPIELNRNNSRSTNQSLVQFPNLRSLKNKVVYQGNHFKSLLRTKYRHDCLFKKIYGHKIIKSRTLSLKALYSSLKSDEKIKQANQLFVQSSYANDLLIYERYKEAYNDPNHLYEFPRLSSVI